MGRKISVFLLLLILAKPSLPASIKWDFNEDGNMGGWNLVSSLTGNVSNGALHLQITGADPYIATDGQSIDASVYKKIKIRMKNSTSSTNMDFFFFSSDYPEGYDLNRFARTVISANDSDYKEYTIDMSNNPYWTGKITVLRIDPVDEATSGDIDIDYIHLVSVSNETWGFEEDGNLEGWNLVSSLTGDVSDGALHLQITGADPYIATDGQSIDASVYKKIKIRMKNGTASTNMDFFFFSSEYPDGYDLNKFARTVISANDTDYKEYTIDMSNNPYWAGKITLLRIDPVDEATSGNIDIDYINLETNPVVEWNFNEDGNTQGWIADHSLSGSVANGIYHLDVTGDDPYFLIPGLSFDASTFKTLKIKMKNNTSDNGMDVYFFSSDYVQDYDGSRYAHATTTANDSGYRVYTIDFSNNPYWTGKITFLRIDPTAANSGSVDIDYISVVEKEPETEKFVLDNGVIKVKVDLEHGGAVSYISQSGTTKNIVNTPDNGRYIQQAYMAGQTINRSAEGQHSSYTPWYWNPMQAGDVYGNTSAIIDTSSSDGILYVKTQPMLFDMKNKPAECYMETWLSVSNNVIHVKNKLTAFRTDNLWQIVPRWMELPHAFIDKEYSKQYTYNGDKPWSEEPITEVFSSGIGWDYYNATEHWCAQVNGDKWGIGIYNPSCVKFAGGYVNLGSNSFTRFSPLNVGLLDKNSTYEYEYDLIVGSLDEIRQYVYSSAGEKPDTALAAEWNFNSTSEGWYSSNNGNTSSADSVLTLNITGKNSAVSSPYGLNINTETYKFVQVTFKNNTASTEASLSWFTNMDIDLPESNTVKFAVIPNDTAYTTYTINLSNNDAWYGRIEQLQVVPASELESGNISIEKVNFASDVTAVEDNNKTVVPTVYSLSQNYPNPFNPATVINYTIPKSGMVTLKVYNILGVEVASLVNKEQTAGSYTVRFNASELASGVYLYKLQSGSYTMSKKMLLLK